MESNADLQPADEGPSVIGSGIFIDGNIEANADLQIRGRVIGDVRCETLLLGQQGEIRGNVVADRVWVSGRVDGAIETGDLALEATARVKGDVGYKRIRMADGAVVEGRLRHGAREDAAEASTARRIEAPARKPASPAPKAQAPVYIE